MITIYCPASVPTQASTLMHCARQQKLYSIFPTSCAVFQRIIADANKFKKEANWLGVCYYSPWSEGGQASVVLIFHSSYLKSTDIEECQPTSVYNSQSSLWHMEISLFTEAHLPHPQFTLSEAGHMQHNQLLARSEHSMKK